MPIRATDQNSVVVANQVNPSIFTLPWMVKQKLFDLDDVQQQGTIIAPQLVQVLTNDFALLVLPNRIQITPSADEARQSEIVHRVMGGIVRQLPETPYTAAAINLNYAMHFSDGEFASRNRALLCRPTVISPFFGEPNANFGSYFSQDYLGCRLKLNVKPALPTKEAAEVLGSPDKFIAFEFNFHKDLTTDEPHLEVLALLDKWEEARVLAKQIVEAAEHG